MLFVIFIIFLILYFNDSEYKDIVKNINVENAKEKIHIIVDIEENKLYVYDLSTGRIIKTYIVATGTWKTPTPTGTYKIIEKDVWGGGFGSKWMKLNVPWGQYGIHGTNKPNSIGYSASHGCVRMKNDDIDELYTIVKYGTKVTLFKGCFGAFGYGFRILKPGHKGEDVMEVQRKLKSLGYYNGIIDGIYGDSMKSALHKFQRDNNVKVTDWISGNIYEKLGIFLFE